MIRNFKGFVISVNFLPIDAITIFPFIFLKKSKLPVIKSWIQHERIHLHQQAELLIVVFYLLYTISYFAGIIRFRSHQKAYRAIIFEREAYAEQNTSNYLTTRKPFAFIKYWFS